MNTIILIAIAIYLIGMLAIGFKYSNNKTSEDFYLGGRKLGPIVTAMSTEASDMSLLRRRGGELDRHRPFPRHLPQLADCRKASAPLLGKARLHHRAGFSGGALS